MKKLKQIISILVITLIMVNFSSCSSAQKLQEETPFSIGEVSSQKWVAGVQGGGAGINVFIPISEIEENIEMKGLYYHGKLVELEKRKDGLYIGRFKTNINQKVDFIIDEDSKKEYGNKVPEIEEKAKIPFELKDNEAILSYMHKGRLKYFKIENIITKQIAAYLSTPKNEGENLIKQ